MLPALLAAAAAPLAHANDDEKHPPSVMEAVKQIISKPDRPRVEEIERIFGGKMPKFLDPSVTSMARTEEIKNRLPKMLALFEQSFPGATWVFLGRDVYDFGDYVDVFYRSIGQKDRVLRFDASKESFKSGFNYEDNHAEIVGYLKTLGIDFSTIDQAKHPYIVVDVASWRPMSQLRQVMRAGYEEYARLGHDPKNLIRKYNVLAIGMSFQREAMSDLEFEPQGFLDHAKPNVTAEGMPGDPIYINGQTAFAYPSDHWHPVFDRFELQADGTAKTKPAWDKYGNKSSEKLSGRWLKERAKLLNNLVKHANTIRSEEFLKTVQRESRALGFEFPLKRTTNLKVKPTRTFVYKERPVFVPSTSSYGGSTSKWEVKESQVGAVMNAQADTFIERVLADDEAPHEQMSAIAIETLSDMLNMTKSGSYTRKEMLWAFRNLLLQFFFDDEASVTRLAELLKNNSLLASFWRSENINSHGDKYAKDAFKAINDAFAAKGLPTTYIEQDYIKDLPFDTAITLAREAIRPRQIPKCNQSAEAVLRIVLEQAKAGQLNQMQVIKAYKEMFAEIYQVDQVVYRRDFEKLIRELLEQPSTASALKLWLPAPPSNKHAFESAANKVVRQMLAKAQAGELGALAKLNCGQFLLGGGH